MPKLVGNCSKAEGCPCFAKCMIHNKDFPYGDETNGRTRAVSRARTYSAEHYQQRIHELTGGRKCSDRKQVTFK